MLQVLFVGLGSIGTRHLQNLYAVAQQPFTVTALRSQQAKPLPEAIQKCIHHEVTVLPQQHYDIAFITNPTSLHFKTLQQLRHCVTTFFIEKPIFEHTQYSLTDCLLAQQKAYVAAPMRWCGVMLALKTQLETQKPYSARVICSSYLPDWRPGVDYRTVYSAHKHLGGGVTIDLIHEWDYLVELFGAPLETHQFKGTYSDLEIDSDDVSVYIARYPEMLCEVHLDYFGRTYRRTIELFCKEGTLTADFGAGTLTLPDGTVQHYEEPVNERYLREMAYFLQYAASDVVESVNTPQTALDVLKITLGEM